MLDINLFRNHPDLVRESQRRRFCPVEQVDEVIELDKEWRQLRFQVDQCNKEINIVQKELDKKFKAKESADEFLAKKREIEANKKSIEMKMLEHKKKIDQLITNMGNIVHDSVPVSKDEDNNGLVKVWPPNFEPKKKEESCSILPHHQVLTKLDGFDPVRGANIVGHRGYFLKNWGVKLNLALINYGLDFLSARGYCLLQTPFFMKKDIMAKTCQLTDYDEQLYKVVSSNSESEDRYLIATSEQPITAFHMNERFENVDEQLPIKYGGFSTCFRKEAGAHGKDTWGLFRIHQFEKVEQLVLTAPDKSWEMFEEMISVSEEFYQSLELPYRIVSIVSGALNNAAAKKYDLEAWFPSYEQFKELVSCSNCTDYHSRTLEIRCGLIGTGKDEEKQYVHCLNSTLCATERALCCILENYQTSEGLKVPKVLQPYMNNTEFIPFVNVNTLNSCSKSMEKISLN